MSAPGPPLLVVEDDDDIREVLVALLEGLGYPASEARDGAEALALLRAGARPRLMLLDLMMPNLDGEGLVAALRGDAALERIPFVVMSGQREAGARGQALGAAAVLLKPVELDQLIAVLERLLGPAPAEPMAPAPQTPYKEW